MSNILPFQPLATSAATVIEKLAARRDRDMERGRRAAEAVKAAGGSAMDAAIAHIEATFSKAAGHNRLKLNVERLFKLGADHPEVRARFGRRVAMFRGQSVDGAIILVERMYRDERKAFQIASALGRGTRLSLDVLADLRLALRFARRKLTDQQFRIIVAGVLGEQISFATA